MTGLVLACAVLLLVVLLAAGRDFALHALIAGVLTQLTLLAFAFAGMDVLFLVAGALSVATAVNYRRVVRRQEPDPS